MFKLQSISTNRDVRISNRKNIVNTLFRNGPMTKQQLADALGLSLPTISIILKDLREKGLVGTGEKQESSGGRPASKLTLLPDARFSVGIGISGETVRLALVNLGPKIVAQEEHALHHEESLAFWEEVHRLTELFIDKYVADRSLILGTGIALNTPMVLDSMVTPDAILTLKGDWSVQNLRSIFGPETLVCNTSKMAGNAQAWGSGDFSDFAYLLIGRGVGGAIIADRQIIAGASKNAEFGHIVLNDEGPQCSCGQRGCFGRYCSSMALMEESGLSIPDFFEKLKLGNKRCKEIWATYLKYLSMGINNIRLILDTDIVIGGEMSVYIADYEDELKALLAQRNPFGDGGSYLHIGRFGEYDSAFGAALTHIDRFLS